MVFLGQKTYTYRTPTGQNDRAQGPSSLQLLSTFRRTEQHFLSIWKQWKGIPRSITCATFHTGGWVISAKMKHISIASSVPEAFQKCLFAICSHCTWSERGRAVKSLRGTLSASYLCCLRIAVWSDFIKIAPPAFVSLNVLLPKVINTDGCSGLSCKEEQEKPLYNKSPHFK